MRVTNYNTYSNFLYNKENNTESLNRVTNQLSTGKKINTIYDNPTTFVNSLRLDQEENTFQQVKTTANSAKTFANQTDTTMNEMSLLLDSFKTKLVDAANSSHSETSRHAIAKELQGELEHLKTLANSSINGKFIFSGTRFNQKPIDSEGNYHGNDKNVKAKIGSEVELPYNIDGKSLFLGRDNDYHKHISMNVIQFDKMKENPKFVVEQDGKKYIDKSIIEHGHTPATDDEPVEENITSESEIRMLTGVNDKYDSATDTYSDGSSRFFISGRRPDGTTFSEYFDLTNSSKVEDLKEKIGSAFGNRINYKAVDIDINKSGQIEIKDTESGKLVTDFTMVAGNAEDGDTTIQDAVNKGHYLVSFNKSNYASVRDQTGVEAENLEFDNSHFKLNTEFRTLDKEEFAKEGDKLQNILYSDTDNDGNNDLDHIKLTGTDTDGNSVDVTLNIDNTTTLKDLENKIKDNFGDVEVSVNNGKLSIVDKTLNDINEKSNLSLKLDAQDSGDNSLPAFGRIDFAQNDKTYFEVKGGNLISNTPQINKNDNSIATDETRLIDVSGKDDIDGKVLNIDFKDIDGNIKSAKITLRDTADSDGHLSTFQIDGDSTVYDILDSRGNKTPIHDVTTVTQYIDPDTCQLCNKKETTKGISYKQLNDVISMLMANKLPAGTTQDDYKTAISDARKSVNAELDSNGRLVINDKNNSSTDMKLSIYDSDTDSGDNSAPVLKFNSNNAITIDSPKIDVFKQLQQAIDDVENGKVRGDGDSEDPRSSGIQGALEAIDHINDHIVRKHTEIGAISNTFDLAINRTETLITHTRVLKSEVLDTDVAEASLKLQQLTLNYQVMLSTIGKVNKLSLVNYI